VLTGTRLTDTQRLDWLRLIRSENIGSHTFHSLLSHFGSATAAVEAVPDLARRGGGRAPKLCSLSAAETEMARARAYRRTPDRARRAGLSGGARSRRWRAASSDSAG